MLDVHPYFRSPRFLAGYTLLAFLLAVVESRLGLLIRVLT